MDLEFLNIELVDDCDCFDYVCGLAENGLLYNFGDKVEDIPLFRDKLKAVDRLKVQMQTDKMFKIMKKLKQEEAPFTWANILMRRQMENED